MHRITVIGYLTIMACSEVGPEGPPGPAGSTGPQGPPGVPGEAGTTAKAHGTIWKDANGTVVPVIATTFGSSITQINTEFYLTDANGIVWYLYVGNTLFLGEARYPPRYYLQPSCQGPMYTNVPARVTFVVPGGTTSGNPLYFKDDVATVLAAVQSKYDPGSSTCTDISFTDFLSAVSEGVEIVRPGATTQYKLPFHPELQ